MYYRYLFPILAVTGFLAAAGPTYAAQGSHNRHIVLPHVCQGGSNAGESCTPDAAECPHSSSPQLGGRRDATEPRAGPGRTASPADSRGLS